MLCSGLLYSRYKTSTLHQTAAPLQVFAFYCILKETFMICALLCANQMHGYYKLCIVNCIAEIAPDRFCRAMCMCVMHMYVVV